jgi:RNA polymerase sigma factor (sigma-70 family)
MMTDDGQLLVRFTTERSDDAFRELVARHIDLVYSAAIRLAGGDAHLAQDITQTVFVDLARKAPGLPRDVVLAGWLYRHACFTASKAVRTERRRQARELTAMEMNAPTDQADANWEQIAPQLEEAMNRLAAQDRDAIVLRFFKRHDLRQVGEVLGISEDAAQKRISRALEKLRAILGQRGLTLSAAGLAAVLTAEAVTAAPAGLALSIAAASITVAGSGITLIKLLTMTKLKTALATALLAAAVTVPLLQNKSVNQLREENMALRQQARNLDQQRAENERLLQSSADELDRLHRETADLARLRGEVASLRRLNGELAKAEAIKQTSRTGEKAAVAGRFIPTSELVDAGLDSPEAALQTFFWAAITGSSNRVEQATDYTVFKKAMQDKMKEQLEPNFDPSQPQDDHFHLDDFHFNVSAINPTNSFQGFQILSQELTSPDIATLEVAATDGAGETETNSLKMNRIGQEWKVNLLSFTDHTSSEEKAISMTLTNNTSDGKELVTKWKLPVDADGNTGKPELVQ